MRILFTLLLLTAAFLTSTRAVFAEEALWPVQSVDTMKYSRDRARSPKTREQIPALTKVVADLGATHIALGTPYDEEFYPFLKVWVSEARKADLNIWFRGNFAGWEDWFGYGRVLTADGHHRKVAAFIAKHPDLFTDGDIFTPAPEPENGALGDPRRSSDKGAAFNTFLERSYENCVQSFAKIHKKVTCGYFSTNGDVAKEILTKETVAKIGGVVVIDHYLKDPAQMTKDIDYLAEKLEAKVVVGEFGGPILDINGPMNETQQAAFNKRLLQSIYASGDKVVGVNYWTLIDGSTALVNLNGIERESIFTLGDYFKPASVAGQVLSSDNLPLRNAHVSWLNRDVMTDRQGNYRVSVPVGEYDLTITAPDYTTFTKKVSVGAHEQKALSVNLEPLNKSWWDSLSGFFGQFFSSGF